MQHSKGLMAAALLVAGSFITSPQVQAQEPPVLAEETDADEKARVQKLIEGAKEEGRLEWVGSFVEQDQSVKFHEVFKEHYGLEDLEIEHTYVGTAELVTRVEQLLKAGNNNFDMTWIPAWAWYQDLLERGELMEYNSPYYADYTLSDKADMSEEGYWVSDAYSFSPMYNPTAMAEHGMEDFTLTSWDDFTNPELKGLVSIGNVLQSTSYAPTAQGIVNVMGEEWMSEVAETIEPVIYSRTSQGRGWVETGEYPIAMMSNAKHAVDMRQNNVDVKLVYPEEGVVLLPFAPAILAQAPHPNAAKLFMDFLRSETGAQAVMDSGAYMFFGRPGIESPYPDLVPAWEDINVIQMDWDVEGTREAMENIRTDFKEAGLGF